MSLTRILTTTVGTVIGVSIVTLLTSCSEQKPESSLPPSSPPAVVGKTPKVTVADVLKAIEKKNDHALPMYRRLEIEFKDTETKIGDSKWADLFGNPVRTTREKITESIEALEGYGSIILPGTLERAEMPFSINSTRLYDFLERGMRGYGHVESGKLNGGQKVLLMPKNILENAIPLDAHLITGGSYRGFFVMKGGDLVIPGLSFYQGVINSTINPDNYPKMLKLPIEEYSIAMDLLHNEDYESGIEVLERVVATPEFISKDVLSEAYYNLGFAHYESSHGTIALTYFDKAIELDPNMGPAHLQKGLVLVYFRREFDSARQEFQIARQVEKDPEKRAKIDRIIQGIEEDINANRIPFHIR